MNTMKKGMKNAGLALSFLAAGSLLTGFGAKEKEHDVVREDLTKSVGCLDPDVACGIDKTREQMSGALVAQAAAPKEFGGLRAFIDRKDEVTMKTLKSYDQKLRGQISQAEKDAKESLDRYKTALETDLSVAYKSHSDSIEAYRKALESSGSRDHQAFKVHCEQTVAGFKKFALEQQNALNGYVDTQNGYMGSLIDTQRTQFNDYLKKLSQDFELSIRTEAGRLHARNSGELEKFVLAEIEAFKAFLNGVGKDFEKVLAGRKVTFEASTTVYKSVYEALVNRNVAALESL